ncbi:MAG: SDR family oxidoreductase [Alphaproteobacteria bacterium]|nr:SDR family oxidoreductase [Alphaproteobacteria bacterium]
MGIDEGFRGSVCIVGAAGGIGEALTRLLHARGAAPVVLMDRPGIGLDALARDCAGTVPVALDLRDCAMIEPAFAAARRSSPRIDALVVCAGIVDVSPLGRLSLERWDEIIAINLTGPFLCCRAALDWISDGGRIVLISSLSARTGGVVTSSGYAASKGGIESFTKAIARELGPRGITVNCVSPGWIDTPMTAPHPAASKAAVEAATPLRRTGKPEEVAATIAFLLSPGARHITGACVAVNGGIRMD